MELSWDNLWKIRVFFPGFFCCQCLFWCPKLWGLQESSLSPIHITHPHCGDFQPNPNSSPCWCSHTNHIHPAFWGRESWRHPWVIELLFLYHGATLHFSSGSPWVCTIHFNGTEPKRAREEERNGCILCCWDPPLPSHSAAFWCPSQPETLLLPLHAPLFPPPSTTLAYLRSCK